MTFKKLLKGDIISSYITGKMWVIAIMIMTSILENLIIPALYLGGSRLRLGSYGVSGVRMISRMQETAGDWFVFSLGLSVVTLLFLAAIAGIFSFSYLFKPRTVDFYDSQPVSHRRRFLTNFFGGIAVYVLVYGIGTLVELAVVVLSGGGYYTLYGAIVVKTLRLFACYIGMYSFVVLAAVLSGNMFIAALLAGFFSLVELVLRLALFACMNFYFATIYESAYVSWMWPRTLPLYHYLAHISRFQAEPGVGWQSAHDMLQMEFTQVWPDTLWCLGMALVAAILSYVAFVKRPREAAGKGLCFSFMESVVKVVVAICAGIFLAIFADGLFSTQYGSSVVTFAVMAICIGLVCVIAECVYAQRISAALKRVWQMPLCILITAVIIVIFKQDLTGFDRYVPEADQVESYVLFPMEAFSYYLITEDSFSGVQIERNAYESEQLKLVDTDAAVEVAEVGMRAQREYMEALAQGWYDDEDHEVKPENGWNATILYRMKDGREIWRDIRVPYDVDREPMDRILGSPEYRKDYYNIEGMQKAIDDYLALDPKCELDAGYDTITFGETEEISREGLRRLMKAYEEDLKQYDFTFTQEHICLGSLRVHMSNGDYSIDATQSFPVYEGYENVAKEMKKIGIYAEPIPKTDEVGLVAIRHMVYDEDNGGDAGSPEKIFEGEEEIADILSAVDIEYTNEWTKWRSYDNYYDVMVIFKDDLISVDRQSDKSYFDRGVGMNYTLFPDDAPEWVRSGF